MLLPVAEHSRRTSQILQLRKLETDLLHRSSLITFIRTHQIKGEQRKRLFEAFHGARDPVDAILIEHRNYLLAESSHLSTDHLIGLMHDTTSLDLLRLYSRAYAMYFSLYCYSASTDDSTMADAVRETMQDAAKRVKRLRSRLLTEKPDSGFADFDREAQLAETGRHKAIDYLNR